MPSFGLNRGLEPTGKADAYAGRSSLRELLRSLPPPTTTLSGMRGEYLQLVQDLAADMQATWSHVSASLARAVCECSCVTVDNATVRDTRVSGVDRPVARCA